MRRTILGTFYLVRGILESCEEGPLRERLVHHTLTGLGVLLIYLCS